MTGIKPDLLKDKPPIENLIVPISEFIGDLHVVGHNIERFDVPFLNNDLKRKGRPVVDSWRVVNALNISRMMYGRKPTERIKHHNLRSCAMRERSASFSSSGHHSAGHDVEVTG